MTRKLIVVDDEAVVADYEAGVNVDAICASHQIALTRLYRILDRHRVPRRQPNAPKLPKRLRKRMLADYRAGIDTEEERDAIARIGCRTRQPGLRSLKLLDPAIADDVLSRLAELLRDKARD